jgi:hypothetical protein
MKKLLYILFSLFISGTLLANVNTPGSGVKWNLSDLTANSGGLISFTNGEYLVNDTVVVNKNDTLIITENATVKFAPNTYLQVYGTLHINPPVGVLFSAQDTAVGFLGARFDSSNTTYVNKLTFERAVSFRLVDCSFRIENSIFRNNNMGTSTTFGNGAIALFRASPRIDNCQFLDNRRAAIQGGSNIANAPRIYNSLFMGNNTTNQNVPQINMGATGTDTVFIVNNQILRASTNSGGIGFLPIGNVYTVITGNVIKNNRYGLTFNGGSNINALVSYNQIDSNNTQNNPSLGGSGIAFTGGAAGSHQNTIVTGNLIRWNLWGITIQGRSRPNLGNLTNTDTTDNGKNYFFGNTNSATPFIELYNNSVDTIYAQNNHWGTEILDSIEARIFHFFDNPSLGPVFYDPVIIPVELVSFAATVAGNTVNLNWITATELNNSGFEIIRNGETAEFVKGSGTTTDPKEYTFTDRNLKSGKYHYELIQIDYDGSRSSIQQVEVEVDAVPAEYSLQQNYPNPFNPSTAINFTLPSDSKVILKIFNTLGEEVATLMNDIMEAGRHTINFDASNIPSGVYIYSLTAGSFTSSKKMTLIK